jgi:hypothetical protein
MTLTSTEAEILKALTELDSAVKSLRLSQARPDLQTLFQRIDSLARELPGEADPQLRHYLAKKSYEKARLFLQGRDGENVAGNCHGHED